MSNSNWLIIADCIDFAIKSSWIYPAMFSDFPVRVNFYDNSIATIEFDCVVTECGKIEIRHPEFGGAARFECVFIVPGDIYGGGIADMLAKSFLKYVSSLDVSRICDGDVFFNMV